LHANLLLFMHYFCWLPATFLQILQRLDPSTLVIHTGSWTGVCKVSRLCHWY